MRSLSPVDYGPILDSVRRTGRMVYAQEAPGFAERRLRDRRDRHGARVLRARGAGAARVGLRHARSRPAKLEGTYLPDADRILEAVDRSLAY